MLVRGCEMDGFRAEVEELDEVCEAWRLERWRERISCDFLVWLIARLGMEGAEESVEGVLVCVSTLLSALAK